MSKLPTPVSVTDQYLHGINTRLDTLIELLQGATLQQEVPPTPTSTPSSTPRKKKVVA